jgi:hypothetical protein
MARKEAPLRVIALAISGFHGISPNLKDDPAKDRRLINWFIFCPYKSGSWMFLVLQKSLIKH